MCRWSVGSVVTAFTLSLALAGCGSSDSSGGSGSGGSSASAGDEASSTSGGPASSGTGGSAAGTGGSGASGGSGGDTGAGGAVEAPTVDMQVEPATVAPGGTMTATVTVTNFVLEAPVGQPNEAGHGHYHIYLDQAKGGNYLIADQKPTVMFKIPPATTPGPHTLRVSVSDNNHVPLSPPVEDTVDITVQ